MYCGKCGNNNPENVKFCSKCGAQLGNSSAPAPAVKTAKKSAKTDKLVGMTIVAVGAVLLILLLSSLFGRGYKDTVKKYIDSSYSADGKAMVEILPKKWVNSYLKNHDCKKKDLIDDIRYELSDRLSGVGSNWSYSYKITDINDVDKDYLNALKEQYKENLGVRISAAKKARVEIDILLKNYNYEYGDTVNVVVVKIGSSWYLDIENTRIL